ncbi:hypothetical protein IE4771_PD00635 (plasmid) [Rhizobium etli bv. mimosae str. IE4771]|uniref:Uncharacterized protein n=1 Tax=Rhizobium etli bv. mimosae str. IE4771 TaxID=1432050 RepID=A0A060IC21_RHIET|nr:hypothetical protein [Rhizobium sp. IE4771]AIC31189.1 hypothetical protein IE4771_PD00635 [Rhizobium sp. IE4771]
MPAAPVLRDIVRQHAEMAAFLWTVFDYHLLHPGENPDMDDLRMARLVERLEAHLDGVRVAGEDGRRIAQERYEEFPEAGELFVLRMLSTSNPIPICELQLDRVRAYLAQNLRR